MHLTYWTARLAMLLYAASLGWRLMFTRRARGLRWLWTAGCAVFLVHVACAFQFMHHWSHADAYAATARRTAEFAGFEWGGGLYFNYLFTLIWVADVAWCWLAPRSHDNRPRIIPWAMHGFMGFLAFNATVVFAAGVTRWLSVAGCLVLAAMAWQVVVRRRASGKPASDSV